MRNAIYVLLFLLLIGNYGINSTVFQYVCASVIFMVSLYAILAKGRVPSLFGVIDYIPLVMMLVWFYGLSLGFLKGNNPLFIISNFAGMSLYFLYYVFRMLMLGKKQLFQVVLGAALVNVGYAFSALLIGGYPSNPSAEVGGCIQLM